MAFQNRPQPKEPEVLSPSSWGIEAARRGQPSDADTNPRALFVSLAQIRRVLGEQAYELLRGRAFNGLVTPRRARAGDATLCWAHVARTVRHALGSALCVGMDRLVLRRITVRCTFSSMDKEYLRDAVPRLESVLRESGHQSMFAQCRHTLS